MHINNVLKKFLQDTSIETGNSLYLTDLENVVGFANKNSFIEMNDSISKALLVKFLYFANDNENKPHYYFTNKKNNVISIMEEKEKNKKWHSQIIFPIFIDDMLYGSLIVVNKFKKFNENKIFHSTEVTAEFVFKILLNALREHNAK